MNKVYISFVYIFLNINYLRSQVFFSNEKASFLGWPFKNSFYINPNEGSNGWEQFYGSIYHVEGDKYAQDWRIKGCVINEYTCGQELISTFQGEVIKVTHSNESYGNQILIQSSENKNFVVRYAHLSQIDVVLGQKVNKDDIIGLIGDSGNGGCHLHIVLYKDVLIKPNNIDSYLDFLLSNDHRPSFNEISAPFRLGANKEKILEEVSWYDELFYEDKEEKILDLNLKNTSEKNTFEFELFITAEKNNKSIILEKKQVKLHPKEEYYLEYKNSILKEGSYNLYTYYSMKNDYYTLGLGSSCTNDTISRAKIKVFSREDCYSTHEPNNTLDLATKIISEGNMKIESYLSSENNINDVDFFEFTPLTNGIISFKETNFNNKLNVELIDSGIKYNVEDIKKGVELVLGKTYYLKIQKKDQDFLGLCLPYLINLSYTTTSNLKEIVIYPNPSNEVVKINTKEANNIYDLYFYDVLGKLILTRRKISSSNEGIITVGWLKKIGTGLYFVKIKNNETLINRGGKLFIK